MGEPKPLASLTSGLLARKGGARPAMRRQPLGSGPAHASGNGYDDLGWNDMGYDVDPEQSSDAPPRLDIKPMLTGSMPAHNAVAEQAVVATDGLDAEPAQFAALPWADPSAFDAQPAKPEIVKQQEVLQARVERAVPIAPIAPVAPLAPDVPVVAAALVAADFAPPAVQPVAAPLAKPSRRAPNARPASAGKARDKAAFTLRLDAERHLRLRLASAIYNRSLQQILIDVLDDYLSALPEIDAMASRLPATPAHRVTTHTSVGDDK